MNEDLSHEVPKYEDQGQQRGRKPQRLSPKAAAKRRAKGKVSEKGPRKMKASKVAKSKVSTIPGKGGTKKSRKGRVGAGRKEKNKRVRRASQCRAASSAASPAEAPMSEAAPRPSRSKRLRRAKHPGTEAPVTPSTEAPVVPINPEQAEFSIPADAVEAPAHVTYNGVYSTAYRRAQTAKCTKDECKHRGKHASWLFRIHQKISPSLSGIPREPRDKKNDVSEGKLDPWIPKRGLQNKFGLSLTFCFPNQDAMYMVYFSRSLSFMYTWFIWYHIIWICCVWSWLGHRTHTSKVLASAPLLWFLPNINMLERGVAANCSSLMLTWQIGNLGFDLTGTQVSNVGSCVPDHLRFAKGGEKMSLSCWNGFSRCSPPTQDLLSASKSFAERDSHWPSACP